MNKQDVKKTAMYKYLKQIMCFPILEKNIIDIIIPIDINGKCCKTI